MCLVESGCMNKVKKIDVEPWKFVLYEVNDCDWFVKFSYSPVSFADTSMTIKLASEEKDKAKLGRQYLIDFSDKLRNNYQSYQNRSVGYDIQSELEVRAKNT